jgi:hypothetical protein
MRHPAASAQLRMIRINRMIQIRVTARQRIDLQLETAVIEARG